MAIFTPPDLFAAIGLAARGDLDLPDGVHVRLMPSPALGFPVAPFGLYRVIVVLAEPQVIWYNRDRQVMGQPSLEAAGGVLFADLAAPDAEVAEDVAVELVTDGDFEGTFTLLDRVGRRAYAERSRRPFVVGGPRVERVAIRGRGRVVGLRTWRVQLSRTFELLLSAEPVALLSLPIEGSRPWYANGLGAGASFDRVLGGAPLRLARPDQPDGPFDPLAPTDEIARVTACVAEGQLDSQCEAMVGDLELLPGRSRHSAEAAATVERRRQFVDISVAKSLLAQAMDPGVGRYLGLVGSVREQLDGSQPAAYVAIGLFAYPDFAAGPDGRPLSVALGPRSPLLGRIEEAYADRMKARAMVEKILATHGAPPWLAGGRGLDARGLLAAFGAVPPPDPPRLGPATLGRSRWLDGRDVSSTAFQQELLFPAPPLGAPVALGRLEDGAWASRHLPFVSLDPPADPATRARTMLLGRTQAKPQKGKTKAASIYLRRGLISDTNIPAGAVPARYRAALADLFGRFGPPVEFDVPSPPRPVPPPPAPQATVVLDGPDGVGGAAASPGRVDVSVAVPSVKHLAAGSRDIVSLSVALDGVAEPDVAVDPIPPDGSGEAVLSIALPPLEVGASATSTLTAVFTDSDGQASATASVAVKYADRRRPFVVPTGLGLVWTSRPGPAPDVELKLAWPAAAGTLYRVYMADAKGLGLQGPSRAEVAVLGGQRARARTLGGRDRFRLLTDPPLVAAGGVATLDEILPRSLGAVQFVRVVPLTSQGREAEFDECGVIPVAVPSDRTPPPPRVTVAVDAGTQVATVTVDAGGLDLVELQAAEPGLFENPPDPAAVAPEFRLRRASGAVNAPIYAREIARGPLLATGDGAALTFSASVDDPGALKPFVHYSYWAEVRMPPERRLALGIVELPPAGGVGPVNSAQVADNARAFSVVSAPVTVISLPPLPVPAPEAGVAAVIEEAGQSRASLAANPVPALSPRAVGPYRLRIWEQWGGGPIGSAVDVELNGLPVAWEGDPADVADHPLPLTLRAMLIDPVGRESAVVTIDA